MTDGKKNFEISINEERRDSSNRFSVKAFREGGV